MPAIPTAAGAKKAVAGSGAGVGAGAAAGAGAGAAAGAVGASGACCGASATAGGGGAAGAWQEGGMEEENRLVLFHGNKAGSFLAFGGVDPFRFPWFCLMAIGSGRKGCNLTRVQKRMGKENGKKMGLFALSASVSKKIPPSTIDIMT